MHIDFEIIEYDYTLCDKSWNISVLHTPPYCRIYYIKSGNGYYIYEGVTYPLIKGHLYVFPAFITYAMFHHLSDPLEILWFHVDLKEGFIVDILHFPINKDTIEFYYINSLCKLCRNGNFSSEIKTLFISFLNYADKIFYFYKKEKPFIQKAINYIDEHLTDEISVNMLADYFNMERSYFSRYFKAKAHSSPQQFIIGRKINKAAIALSNGKTINEAFEASGYKDEKAFIRSFNANMRMTPSKYRKFMYGDRKNI